MEKKGKKQNVQKPNAPSVGFCFFNACFLVGKLDDYESEVVERAMVLGKVFVRLTFNEHSVSCTETVVDARGVGVCGAWFLIA